MNRRALTVAGLLGLCACGSIKQNVSPRDAAVDDMNHQDYDDAITTLEQLHSQSPGDGEISVLLASAYVGSAGFDIIEAYGAFEPLLFHDIKGNDGASLALDDSTLSSASPTPTPTPSATPAPAPTADTGPASADVLSQLETGSVKFLDEFTTNFKTFVGIPYIQGDKRHRLVQALLILDAVDKTNSSYVEAHTYGAVVNALQFLNYTRDSMTDALGKDEITFLDALCAIQPDTFLQNLDTSTAYLLSSTNDLSIAYTAHSKTLPAALTKLGALATNIKQVYDANQAQITDASLVFSATKASYCQ